MIVRAHAKLTLALHVTRLRDDGFHEIEALTASIDAPADEVEVTLADDGPSTLSVAGAATAGVPDDGANLALAAAERAIEQFAPGRGAHVRLTKAIPPGTGLGGGSADAAAALHAVASLTAARNRDLSAVAAALGSDVPFCATGGLAWMRGRGEILEPLPFAAGWAAVVAVPALSLPTPAVYRRWDDLGGPRSDRVVPAPAALASVLAGFRNDLEPAALAVEPALAAFRDRIEARAGRPALLAGSGSSYAFVVDDPDEAVAIRDRVEDEAILAVVAAPVPAGVSTVAG